jgi:hypothetical protein
MSAPTSRLYQQVADVIRAHSGTEPLVEAVSALVLDEFESFVAARVDEVLEQTDHLPAPDCLGHTEAEAAQRWCPFAREVTPLGKAKRDAAAGNRYLTDKDDYTNPAGCRCIASHCMAWRWLSEGRGHCGLAGSVTHMPNAEPQHLPNRVPLARIYPTQPDQFDGAADCRHGSADPRPEAAALETQMPTRDQIFPPKSLKAAGLNGQPLTLVIKRAPVEALTSPDGKQEKKTVLYFDNGQKLPLNQTNWDAVVDVTGEADSDNWPGHKIEVYPTTTPMGGKMVDCVRIRTPMVRPAPRSRSNPPTANDLDDEIGF